MSTVDRDEPGDSSLSLYLQFVEICNRFESAWKNGERPQLETYVAEAADLSGILFGMLLPLELSCRTQLGEHFTEQEYLDRFPEFAHVVKQTFESLTIAASGPSHEADDRRNGRSRHRPVPWHLLVGILALQNGFITQETLVRAIEDWARDKSRELGAMLVETGHLDAAKLGLLQIIAEEHRKRHGDDLRKILDSLDPLAPVIRCLQSLDDPEVRTTVSIPWSSEARDEDQNQSRTNGPDLNTTPRWNQPGPLRYQVRDFFSAGNLGIISTALDLELLRVVAFKEAQDKILEHPHMIKQFFVEGLITGGLEHPGIVPVYGLGRREDGRPYYAMRLVKGANLKKKLRMLHDPTQSEASDPNDPEPPTLPRLLRHFVTACHAMAYAHSRGVLHRDMKPDHIMLGPFGETMIVDWGLAMQIPRATGGADLPADGTLGLPPELSSKANRDGSLEGTLAYMSPEQAERRISELDERSDIYSLGATLYELLTGSAPHQGRSSEILPKVLKGELTPPREKNPNVPAPLAAICLKAMSRDRDERYSSASALARDIENWLDDEPVSAHLDRWTERAGRWLRHHRTATAGVATALVSAVIGLAALSIETTRANTEINAAKVQADTNYTMALDVVQNLLGTVAVELTQITGGEGLWRKVASQAAERLEILQAQRSNDPRILIAAAKGYRQLGNILRLIGDETAADAHARSLDLTRKAVHLDGANVNWRDLLAEMLTGPPSPRESEASTISLGRSITKQCK